MWSKFKLYYHTLKYLKTRQIKYRLYYLLRAKWRGLTGFNYPQPEEIPAIQKLRLLSSIKTRAAYSPESCRFEFLNLEVLFPAEIDWNYSGHGKLWTYNLNYFEFLHQESMDRAQGLGLIKTYIAQLDAQKLKDGIEPFPIALRLIFWIRFLIEESIADPAINKALYFQLLLLNDKLEYHLLGNHLLENGFALLFGAYFFEDKKIYQQAKIILEEQLEEQILADGAHFELSPMYHQIMLYRLLDCINLVENNTVFNKELLPFLKQKAELMLAWLRNMTFQSGDIPLFNDSAFGVAPSSGELFDYAHRLSLKTLEQPLKESAYRRIEKANYEMLLDVGNIGPDYIPGHAHSDTFSFELQIGKQPFIVDTGTSTYEKNARRQKERSTSAHNTVQVGELEQSQVWGGFRVARRAKINSLKETKDLIIATHDGYQKNKITHQRSFRFLEQAIIIEDQIIGSETAVAKAFFHFSPGVELQQKNETIITTQGQLTFEGSDAIDIEEYEYAPEFNRRQSASRIIVNFKHKLITKMVFA